MRTPSRRQLLRLSGTAVAGSLAGCVDGLVGADDSEADPLSLDRLMFENRTPEFQTVHVYLSRRESEELVFWDSTTAPPDESAIFEDSPRHIPADTVLTARLGNASFAGPADEVVSPEPLREGPSCLRVTLFVEDGRLSNTYEPQPESCEQSAPELSVTSLTQTSKITVANDADSNFGRSVSLAADGTTALVVGDTGIRIFTHGNDWIQQARLTVDGDTLYPPAALSADGTTAIADHSEFGGPYRVALFRQRADGWGHSTELTTEGIDIHSVSLTAAGQTAALASDTSVSVFTFDGTWGRQTRLTEFEGTIGTIELSDDGSTLAVTVHPDEGDSVVHFFAADSGSWHRQATVGPAGGDVVLAADGSIALLNFGRNQEPVVFTRDDGAWTEQSRLTVSDADPSARRFGSAVALSADGSRALVGAEGTPRNSYYDAGAAYLFDRDGDTWTPQERLVADDGDQDDYFGFAVALSENGDVALVGAPEAESHNTSNAGAAYVFRY